MLRSCVGWSCGPSDDLEDIPVPSLWLEGAKGTPAACPVMYLSRCLVPSAASSFSCTLQESSVPPSSQRFQPWQQLFRRLD